MKNKIVDLRNILFAQLEKLSDDECDLNKETTRASSIVQIANCIIDSARAENEFLEVTGGNGSGFIEERPDKSIENKQ